MELRHILSIAFAAFSFIGCSNNEPSLKDKAEKFVKDSILTNFNDPKSFEFVSFKIDTITGKSMDDNYREFHKINFSDTLKESFKDTTSFLRRDYESNKTALEHLDKFPTKSDSIINVNIAINYRAKNKMGALMLDNMLLFYHPETKAFEVIRLQDK